MSRRLHEHHRTLREAEVWLRDVPRTGSFRVALCYPNLYYVGMSNLGLPGRLPDAERPRPTSSASAPSCPTTWTREELERDAASPLTSFETRHAAARLRRGRLLGLVRERLPARPARCCAWPGIPLRAADRGPRDPAGRPGRGRDVPEPGAAGALRRPDRGGRGRGAGAAHDGGARSGAPTRARASTRCRRRTASTSRRATRCATTTTAPWPPTTGPGPVIRQRGWPGKMAAAAVGDPHAEHRDVA